MSDKIFESMLTLNFNNSEIREDYKNQLEISLKKRAVLFISILLVLNISNILLYNFYTSDLLFYFYLKVWAYNLTGINLVTLAIAVINKNITVIKLSTYINFFTSYFTNFIMREFFGDYVKVDTYIIALIYTIQSLYIISWYYTNAISFFPGLILTVCKTISLYVTFGYFILPEKQFRISITAFVYLFTCFLAYTYVYERKKSFYYFKLMEMRKGYYQNILENMNSGFLSISGDKVKYINKALISKLNLQKPFDSCSTHNHEENINFREKENVNLNVSNLLKELINDIELNKSVKESISDNQPAVEAIIDYLRINTSTKFCVLGTNHLKISENVSVYFEISARYYITSFNNEENIEFIFNDVSNIKNKEEVSAEFKYKTMFLSKVAHEFKNPILCITELVDQVNERIFKTKNTTCEELTTNNFCQISDILRSIKSMSNYLIILIKDMDFFSVKSQNISNIKLDKDFVKLDSIISFIKDITNILIKKFDKQDHIIFTVELSSLLPTQLYTDELRLKQILINLLSNSVKYTIHGEIVLEILSEDDKIIFIVKDTGLGIPSSKRASLFQPFMPTNKNYNNISAGLGLFIVKEILDHLEVA
jgi:signal transduction histidine kinase